jgi:hypothetical protein
MYQIGQTVCVVETLRHEPRVRDATIVKLGRKWAVLSDKCGRFDILTGDLDGGTYSSRGRVYPSREAYEQEQALFKEWSKLTERVRRSYRPPSGVTLEDIQTFLQRLG